MKLELVIRAGKRLAFTCDFAGRLILRHIDRPRVTAIKCPRCNRWVRPAAYNPRTHHCRRCGRPGAAYAHFQQVRQTRETHLRVTIDPARRTARRAPPTNERNAVA